MRHSHSYIALFPFPSAAQKLFPFPWEFHSKGIPIPTNTSNADKGCYKLKTKDYVP